jgi:hypothetical protein
LPVFAAGEAAGEAVGDAFTAGLFAGLAFVAGADSVVLAGEAAVVGDDVVAGELEFEFELVAGSSVQPTANAIISTAGSNRALRPINLVFEILIVSLVRARLKSTLIIARND